MKRLGFFSLGAVLAVAVGTVAACSDDDDPGAGSSSGDAGPKSDAATSSSSSGSNCPAAEPVDPSCNAAKCTADLGVKAICVAGTCQKLVLEGDCKDEDIFGAFADDRAIWIGGAMAMTQGNGKINTSGPPRRNSIQFAVDELNEQGGIPGTDTCNEARPIAAIVCDDGGGRNTSGTTDVTERIGNHLVNTLGIKAIIGGGTSGPTIALAQKVTIPGNALIIAPSATAIAITNLEGANAASGERLVWRTAPSDLLQSKALLELYKGVVAAKGGTTKLAIVDKGDAYGKGLGDAVQAGAKLNGADIPAGNTGDVDGGSSVENFYRAQCAGGAPADGGAQPCQAQIDALVALEPTIIVLAGTGESVTNVLAPYEATTPAVKPFYLVPDGPAKPELWAAVKADSDNGGDLAARIQGTVPGASTPLAQNFFNASYKIKYPQVPNEDGTLVDSTLVFGMAGSYDATYLLAYSIISTNTNAKSYTGLELARGFAKSIGGAPIDVGTANFSQAVGALRGGLNIDFNGASGPLDFDLATGTAPSNMIIWCVRKNPNTQNFERTDNTGQFFNSVTGQLEGTYACPE